MKLQQNGIKQLARDRDLHEIDKKRNIIDQIKALNLRKLQEAKQQLADISPPHSHKHSPEAVADIPKHLNASSSAKKPTPFDKNVGISDTDKMLFDKKFKNYLNHRQEYLQKARKKGSKAGNNQKGDKKCIVSGGDAEYYNEEEVLSNTGSDYQYRDANDMQAAYDQMTTGKKRKGSHMQLYHCEYYENEFRRYQFDNLLANSSQEEQVLLSISKDRFLNYLFDEPCVMMLYSINPYQLGDQLAEFETNNNAVLNYQEFSRFLLTDREPTYFQYSRQNLAEARKLGRGIKCAPIIAKWIDETGIYEFLIDLFKDVDMHGNGLVDRSFLAKKIRREAQLRRFTEIEVIEVVNINKMLPLNRLLYEIEFEERGESQDWSFQEFEQFLSDYKRRITPEKDKLITKLILAGKYDSSYVYIISQQVLEIVKEIFDKTPKYAEYFVLKQKLLQNICQDPRYKRIQSMNVRSEGNKYVKKESFQQTLIRIFAEGETYLDIEEVLDFLTNRGRPKLVEYKVYIENLERQLKIIDQEEAEKKAKYGEDYDTTSSDEQFSQIVKEKRIKRKQDKLLQIRNANAFSHDKKFNVTIPMPFGFDVRDKTKKVSIREQKLKQMLAEQERALIESMKPVKCKDVPKFVKDNLYEKMLKDEARERKERLERFRLQIMSQVHVSDRLMRPKSTEIHCDFSGEEYKFIARPMPWYCEVNLIDRINKKKQERRQRILEELITRNTDFDLPEGVQRMMNRQEEREEKRAAKDRTASTGSLNECTFNPRITQGIPDFKTIHEHLHFDLENAKNVKPEIQVVPFSFDNRPGRSKTTYPSKKAPEGNQHRHSRYEKLQNHEDFTNIPKTQKFQALVELRRKQLQEKQRQLSREKRSQAVRKLREQKFAPLVRKAMKENSHDISKSRAIIADKIKQFKREDKRKKVEYQNQMIKIYTKVFQRPLLVENGGIEANEASKTEKERSPSKHAESQLKKSKQKKEDKGDYLQNYYEAPQRREDHRGIPQQKVVNMENDRRRAAVEDHQLGQYSQDEEEEYEEGYEEQDVYQQNYEGGGNLHTS